MVFDEDFALLEIMGDSINLSPLYDHEFKLICNMCFVGDDELLLVDGNACLRLLSWKTQTLRYIHSSFSKKV